LLSAVPGAALLMETYLTYNHRFLYSLSIKKKVPIKKSKKEKNNNGIFGNKNRTFAG
jgi:hypothetical protein